MAALLPLSNTMLVRIYERVGLAEATEVIPLVLDVPLSVAVGGYLFGVIVGSYLSVVAVRTFVSGDRGQFPSAPSPGTSRWLSRTSWWAGWCTGCSWLSAPSCSSSPDCWPTSRSCSCSPSSPSRTGTSSTPCGRATA
ncbi:hypothetical protein ACFQER_06305 [Halomicroarcula sp. GCM10025894]|uniref:hypothetical protein n=1 Tax=Halomicroarcula sp. GCM10025894 TaxID=3252673 RepID=UPI0036194434